MKWFSVAAGGSARGKASMALGPFLEAACAAAAEPALPASEALPTSPNNTVKHPTTGMEGGPTHTDTSEMRAAGFLPMKTPVLPKVMGPPTWGIGGTAGVHMGHTC